MYITILYIFVLYNIINIFTQECKGTVGGVEFDISAYVTDQYHEVIDMSTVGGIRENVTYYFNFCKESQYARHAEECFVTGDEEFGYNRNSAMAYRHDNLNNACNRLSGEPNKTNMIWAPYEPFNPSLGVKYVNFGGDPICYYRNDDGSCGYSDKRSFSITFRCTDDFAPLPKQAFVENLVPAMFGFEFSTSAGCPIACPRINGRVCHGHGTCSYDTIDLVTRCFCNIGYTGSECNKVEKTVFTTSTTAFMILTIVLLVLVIAFVAYIFYRLRKVNVNPDSYESLENRFNQLGQMVG